jgi:hypothetical protein
MKITRFLALLALCSFSLSGCQKADPNLWVAIKDIPVYEDHAGDAQKVSFNLHAGDECLPGAVETEKVYQYTEVTCPGKGHGWVVGSDFKRIKRGRRKPNGQ